MKPTNNKTMAKTIYTIALGFNYRQRKAVLKFNGYNFVRFGKGDHELWSNGVVDIVIMQNDKGCSFVDFCRKNKIVFTDEKGRKVYWYNIHSKNYKNFLWKQEFGIEIDIIINA